MIHTRIVQGIGGSGELVNVRVSLRRVSVSFLFFFTRGCVVDDY